MLQSNMFLQTRLQLKSLITNRPVIFPVTLSLAAFEGSLLRVSQLVLVQLIFPDELLPAQTARIRPLTQGLQALDLDIIIIASLCMDMDINLCVKLIG
jgi:hypothetical protein